MVTEQIGAREHRSMKSSRSMQPGSKGSGRRRNLKKSTKEYKLRYSGRQLKARKKKFDKALKRINDDKKAIDKNLTEEKKLRAELEKNNNPESKSYQNKVKRLEKIRRKNMELIVKTTNDVKDYNEANYQYYGALADDYHTLSRNMAVKINNGIVDLEKIERDPNRREEAFQMRIKIKKLEMFKQVVDTKTEQYYKQANQLN